MSPDCPKLVRANQGAASDRDWACCARVTNCNGTVAGWRGELVGL
jgi:hypothetical protein